MKELSLQVFLPFFVHIIAFIIFSTIFSHFSAIFLQPLLLVGTL